MISFLAAGFPGSKRKTHVILRPKVAGAALRAVLSGASEGGNFFVIGGWPFLPAAWILPTFKMRYH
jgi:hypothetical protein